MKPTISPAPRLTAIVNDSQVPESQFDTVSNAELSAIYPEAAEPPPTGKHESNLTQAAREPARGVKRRMNVTQSLPRPCPLAMIVNDSQIPESQFDTVSNQELSVILPDAAESDPTVKREDETDDDELSTTASQSSVDRDEGAHCATRWSSPGLPSVSPVILLQYRIWLATPRAHAYTTARRSERRHVTAWDETVGPRVRTQYDGDLAAHTWATFQPLIISKFAEQDADVPHEIRVNSCAWEVRWRAIIQNHPKYCEENRNYIEGELTWAAFIAEVRKPFTPYQKFIIRCCTSAPQLMILPGKHCPTITYLPKPPRRPDYCNNVEDIKEYLLMEAKYDSRSLVPEGMGPVIINPCNTSQFMRLTKTLLHEWALGIKHDPSKTINWTHPPEGPDCTWEPLSNLVPPSIVGSNQASIVPSAMPLTTGKLNHHSQGAHQKPHQTPPDHTMEEFLHLSHIHPDDTRTRALLLSLKITHWVYFKYSTEDSLRRLGFIEGPARFLSLQLTGWEYNEHSRGVQSSNHTMEEFLHLAHIVPEDGETRTLISDLFITHWSYFKYSTEDSLRDLGFVEGPARYLFLAGHKHS
ncbi:hypothetical protein PCANC_20678 [Puccinia coronata f. sp. avenae]|uniref:Uncharacterized protein n=1 Tax=Puccinia coronata f. sp. avenae TaxID=200324 RepID=A0A2N5TZW5_9BASI|nr:hypothetical protein PCASD_23413 [Puccinia coronata f. sp. avenae]PLW30978.1 hypothetical protein PCANC_20678 [Puccinia coronata f. sp. avenae]